MRHILDWLHIAMKFKAAQRSLGGSKFIDSSECEAFEQAISHAKWLVWHGKAGKAATRLQQLDETLLARPAYESSTLWWNLHSVLGYIRDNPGLVKYARRHHKGLPISSSIAESAINQIVSLRMAKQRQMRWSDEGAHLRLRAGTAGHPQGTHAHDGRNGGRCVDSRPALRRQSHQTCSPS